MEYLPTVRVGMALLMQKYRSLKVLTYSSFGHYLMSQEQFQQLEYIWKLVATELELLSR